MRRHIRGRRQEEDADPSPETQDGDGAESGEVMSRRLSKKNALKCYYGNTVLFKKYCPKCQAISIMIDGKCVDCKQGLNLAATKKFIHKRESTTDLIRHQPPSKVKKEILQHQNNQCLYCGCHLNLRGMHWDHFIPFATGASGDKNWVASCAQCNSFKSAYLFNSVEEAQIFLQNKRQERGLPIHDYFGGTYEVCKI